MCLAVWMAIASDAVSGKILAMFFPVMAFVAMGFDVEAVVGAFEYVGIDKMGGEDYELEEAYMGDITARLFGEA